MASNIKAKIIITSGIILIVGITSAIVASHVRKKRILKRIYDSIGDIETEAGQQALLEETQQLLGSNAFDPLFWQKTSGIKPDPNLLMPTSIARESAKRINNLIGFSWSANRWGSDEKKIIAEFKKLKSKGQVSQVASAYANAPLNYGDLSRDVTKALTWWGNDDYIKQLTTFINTLPN
jgi:hypothetical protein